VTQRPTPHRAQRRIGVSFSARSSGSAAGYGSSSFETRFHKDARWWESPCPDLARAPGASNSHRATLLPLAATSSPAARQGISGGVCTLPEIAMSDFLCSVCTLIFSIHGALLDKRRLLLKLFCPRCHEGVVESDQAPKLDKVEFWYTCKACRTKFVITDVFITQPGMVVPVCVCSSRAFFIETAGASHRTVFGRMTPMPPSTDGVEMEQKEGTSIDFDRP
jgi:hypothetical protein